MYVLLGLVWQSIHHEGHEACPEPFGYAQDKLRRREHEVGPQHAAPLSEPFVSFDLRGKRNQGDGARLPHGSLKNPYLSAFLKMLTALSASAALSKAK